MNIVFCSILHEIFSYSIKHGKRFDLETVKDVLRAALQVLPKAAGYRSVTVSCRKMLWKSRSLSCAG